MIKTDKKKDARIVKDLRIMVKRYGFSDVRRVANKYIRDVKDKERLKKEIAEAEEKLNALKKKS